MPSEYFARTCSPVWFEIRPRNKLPDIIEAIGEDRSVQTDFHPTCLYRNRQSVKTDATLAGGDAEEITARRP